MNTEKIMKKCQIGSHNLNDANNLLAECYGTIGLLSAQRDELLAALDLIAPHWNSEIEYLQGDAVRHGNAIYKLANLGYRTPARSTGETPGHYDKWWFVAKCEAQS